MTQVAIISAAQATALRGKEYAPNCYFNPIQDKESNWVISKEEIDYVKKYAGKEEIINEEKVELKDYEFVKILTLKTHTGLKESTTETIKPK